LEGKPGDSHTGLGRGAVRLYEKKRGKGKKKKLQCATTYGEEVDEIALAQ